MKHLDMCTFICLSLDHLFLANGVLPAHTVFPEGEPCRTLPTPVPTLPATELPEMPAPIVADPVPGPIDDADARVHSLTPIAYRVVQGRPMLFVFPGDQDRL